MHILDQIVAQKKKEVAERSALYPLALLEKSIYYDSSTVSLSKYLKRDDKSGIIAEFKRRSPSRPEINIYADVEEVTVGYMQGGASALSILTDKSFFGGSIEDLKIARKNNFCPILRKDFIIDRYQIHEARSIGADAILLISEILTKEEVNHFSELAKDLDMEVLLELHSEDQLDKISSSVDVIGVNNRDLTVFKSDLSTSEKLFSKLPSEMVKISESGIHQVEDVIRLKACGYQGFLIGEKFMKQDHPGQACHSFIKQINQAYAH